MQLPAQATADLKRNEERMAAVAQLEAEAESATAKLAAAEDRASSAEVATEVG